MRRIGALLAWLPRPFDEHADPTHITVSAIVRAGEEVVLHRHRRLGIWLQPGGHVEGDESPDDAVLREIREETGLVTSHPAEGPVLIHVDVHEGGRGHLHLDLRYLLAAPVGAPLRPAAGESAEVGWFTREDALEVTDTSAAAAVEAAFEHVTIEPRVVPRRRVARTPRR